MQQGEKSPSNSEVPNKQCYWTSAGIAPVRQCSRLRGQFARSQSAIWRRTNQVTAAGGRVFAPNAGVVRYQAPKALTIADVQREGVGEKETICRKALCAQKE